MVPHTCNPSYAGGGGVRISVQGWPGQKKLVRFPFQKKRERERKKEQKIKEKKQVGHGGTHL
jgi:hypothetical protein